MKNILTLVTICLLSFTIAGQEKQNDATFKETIDFLNKYKYHIKGVWLPKWYNPFGEIYLDYFIKKEVYGGYFEIRVASKYSKNEPTRIEIPWGRLRSVSWGGNKAIFINLTGDYVETSKKGRDGKYTYAKGNRIILKVPDDEMRPRYAKALKHLTYLSTQIREKRRRNSGDKF